MRGRESHEQLYYDLPTFFPRRQTRLYDIREFLLAILSYISLFLAETSLDFLTI